MRIIETFTFGSFFAVAWLGMLVGWNFVDATRPWLVDEKYNAVSLTMPLEELRRLDPSRGVGLLLTQHYRLTGLAMLGMSGLYLCIVLMATHNNLLVGVTSVLWSAWMAAAHLMELEVTTASVHQNPFKFATGLQLLGTFLFFMTLFLKSPEKGGEALEGTTSPPAGWPPRKETLMGYADISPPPGLAEETNMEHKKKH